MNTLRRSGYLSLADLSELLGRYPRTRDANRLRLQLAHPERAPTRSEFESDRDRDADLLAIGIPTVRVTWTRFSLMPDREATRLHAILARRAPAQ